MAFSFIGKFFGKTTSEAAAFALGGAMRSPLEPPLQELTNQTWDQFVTAGITLPTEPGTAATIVAEGIATEDWGKGQASQRGTGGEQFDYLRQAAESGPGINELYAAWRRGFITDELFVHGLRKMKLEPTYDEAMKQLADELLSPADLAMARQQGFVDDARQLADSAKQGVPADNAQVLYELAGLPPGAAEAQTLANRGLIDRPTFDQIVREGHTKTKYTDLLWQAKAARLSAAEVVNLWVRTWITRAEALPLLAVWGFDDVQADQLYNGHGRPPGPGQLQTAFNRGLIDRTRFNKGLAESDVRNEWQDVEFALRARYPSAFALRAAVTSGGISPERAKVILAYEGWEQQDIDGVVAAWTGAKSSAGKALTLSLLRAEYEGGFMTEAAFRAAVSALGYAPAEVDQLVHLGDAALAKSYRDAGVKLVNKQYLLHKLTEAEVRVKLAAFGLSPEAIDHLLPIWTLEQSAAVHELTAAQVKAAYKKALLTDAQATTELEDRGYSAADAATYLAE
jgi:hypothetical protein